MALASVGHLAVEAPALEGALVLIALVLADGPDVRGNADAPGEEGVDGPGGYAAGKEAPEDGEARDAYVQDKVQPEKLAAIGPEDSLFFFVLALIEPTLLGTPPRSGWDTQLVRHLDEFFGRAFFGSFALFGPCHAGLRELKIQNAKLKMLGKGELNGFWSE